MIKKIIILLSGSLFFFILWNLGFEKIYAHILMFGSSAVLSPFSNITTVLQLDQQHPDFCLAIGKDGYCMQLQLFSLSIVVLLSWYTLLLIINFSKKMVLIALKHLAIFYLLQILTMSTLALYDYGIIFRQLNDALRQSFIIIAMVFIIWDNYLLGIFKFKLKSK
jgi:hypothetical protein